LVYLCFRHRKALELKKRIPAVPAQGDDLPIVTIQLPLFNEATVATRLLDAVSRMDYPKDRLEVQVLDDSTDETQALVLAHVERLVAEGANFVYQHRTKRGSPMPRASSSLFSMRISFRSPTFCASVCRISSAPTSAWCRRAGAT
jgi:cellulose synthase/poly-beta-1,6-N-acetylglucosamine synthase-like glycosyltransferase